METICWFMVIFGISSGDLWLKKRIEESGEGDGKDMPEAAGLQRLVLGGRIRLRRYRNRGAMLNLGQNRSGVVAVLSVALCVFLSAVFLFSLGRRGNRTLRAGLAILLGGAFSNTYDRLKRKYVVDYFSFEVRWKPLQNIVFNLSDFCILIGAMLAVLGAA